MTRVIATDRVLEIHWPSGFGSIQVMNQSPNDELFTSDGVIKMKELNVNDLNNISGGEFVPGWPTPEMLCLDAKLLVISGRNEPAFDITAAMGALMKSCPTDFGSANAAHEYATSGGIPTP